MIISATIHGTTISATIPGKTKQTPCILRSLEIWGALTSEQIRWGLGLEAAPLAELEEYQRLGLLNCNDGLWSIDWEKATPYYEQRKWRPFPPEGTEAARERARDLAAERGVECPLTYHPIAP